MDSLPPASNLKLKMPAQRPGSKKDSSKDPSKEQSVGIKALIRLTGDHHSFFDNTLTMDSNLHREFQAWVTQENIILQKLELRASDFHESGPP